MLAPRKQLGEFDVRQTNSEFAHSRVRAERSGDEIQAAMMRREMWASHSATDARKSSTGVLNSRLDLKCFRVAVCDYPTKSVKTSRLPRFYHAPDGAD